MSKRDPVTDKLNACLRRRGLMLGKEQLTAIKSLRKTKAIRIAIEVREEERNDNSVN